MNETLLWGAPLMLAAVGVAALATGRAGLERVLGTADARIAHWLIGFGALVGGAVVAIAEPVPLVRLPAIALGIAGAWTIALAVRAATRLRTGTVERAITASAERRGSRPIDSPHGEQDRRAARDP